MIKIRIQQEDFDVSAEIKSMSSKTVGAIEMSQSSGELGTISVDFSFKEVIQTDANGRVKNSGYRPSASTTRPRMLTPPSSPYGAMGGQYNAI